MINLRYKLLAGLLVLVGVFMYGRCGRSGPKPVPVLPSNDAAQIVVNPGNHTVTIVTPSEHHTSFLPDSPTVIDIGHNGSVNLRVKTFGLESEAFGGIGYVEHARIMGGLDLLYFRRFDVGVGVTLDLSPVSLVNARAAVTLSYTIASNTRVTFAYDNHQQIGGFVTLRF
jgi:hypothetical protein